MSKDNMEGANNGGESKTTTDITVADALAPVNGTADDAEGDSKQASASSSRAAKSRASPKKTKSSASIKSRATPPPKLRRRLSAKDSDVSDSDGGGEAGEKVEDKAGTSGEAGMPLSEDMLPVAVSGIVEETPSAIKLLESQVMEKSSTAAGDGVSATSVKSEVGTAAAAERNSAGANSHPGSATSHKMPQQYTHQQQQQQEQPTNGHHAQSVTSPLDALPSSPTRSRVSASTAEPTTSSDARIQMHSHNAAAAGDDSSSAAAAAARFSRHQSQPHVQIKAGDARHRGDQSVETTKTMSQMAKERPLVQKAHSYRYEPPATPLPDDSLSETKTELIKRVQGQLQQWEKQLDHIQTGREQADKQHKHELRKSKTLIHELKVQNDEKERQRRQLDEERARLAEQLLSTTDDLVDRETTLEQTQDQLKQYEEACQDLEEQRTSLETEVAQLDDELQQNEVLRRRLNEQVTQLQGQLAIEEQRSRFCILL